MTTLATPLDLLDVIIVGCLLGIAGLLAISECIDNAKVDILKAIAEQRKAKE